MYRHARVVLQEFLSKHPLTQSRSRSLSNEITPDAKSTKNEATSRKIQIQKGSNDNKVHDFTKEKMLLLYKLLCNRLVNPFLDLIIPGIKSEDQLYNLTDFRKGKWLGHAKGVGVHYSKCLEEPTPFKLKKALEIEDCIIKDPRLVFNNRTKIKTDFGKFFTKHKRLVRQKAKTDELEDVSSLWYKIFLKRSVDSKVKSVIPHIHSGHLGRLCDFRVYDDAFNLGHTHMKEKSEHSTLIKHSLNATTGVKNNISNKVQEKIGKTSRTSLSDRVENQEPVTGMQDTHKGTQILNELKPEQKKYIDSSQIIGKHIESSNKSDLKLTTSSKTQAKIERAINVQNAYMKDSDKKASTSYKLGESLNVLGKGTEKAASHHTKTMKSIPSSVKENATDKTKVNKSVITPSEVKTKNSVDQIKEKRKTISTNDKEVSRKVDMNPVKQSVKGIAIKSLNKEGINKINVAKKKSNIELPSGQSRVKHKETAGNKTDTPLTKHEEPSNKKILHSSTVSTAPNKLGVEDKPSRHMESTINGNNVERKEVDPKSSEILVKSIKLQTFLDKEKSFNEKSQLIEKKIPTNNKKLSNITDKPKFSVKRNLKFSPTPSAKEKKKTLTKIASDNSPKPKLVTFKTTEEEPYFETKESNLRGVASDLISLKNVIESEGKALTHKHNKHTNDAQKENKEVKPTNNMKITELNQKPLQYQEPAGSSKTESFKGNQHVSAVDAVPKHDISHQNQVKNQNQQEDQKQTVAGNKHQHRTKKGADLNYENRLQSQKHTEEINHTQRKTKQQAVLSNQHLHLTQNQADVSNTKIIYNTTQADGKNTHDSNKLTGNPISVGNVTSLIRQSEEVVVSKNTQVDQDGVKVSPVKNLSHSRTSRSLDYKSKSEMLDSNFEIKQNVFNKVSTSGENRLADFQKRTQSVGKTDLKETKEPKPQFDSKKEGIRLIKDKQKHTFSVITKTRNDKFNVLKYEANANKNSKIEVVSKKIASENLKQTVKMSLSENKLSKGSPTKTAVEKLPLTTSANKEQANENFKPSVNRSISETKLNKHSPAKTSRDEKLPPTKSAIIEIASENFKPTVKRSVSESKLNKDSPTKTADEKQPPTKSSTKEMASEISKPTLKRSFSENKLNKESPTQTADEKQPPAKSATTEIASENFQLTVKRSVSESKLNKESPTKTADEKQPPTKSSTKEMASEISKPTLKRSFSENKLNKESPTKTADEKQPPTKSSTKEMANEISKPTLKRSFSENKLNKESPTQTADEKQPPAKSATTEIASENFKRTVKRSVSESKLNKHSRTKTADDKQPPAKSATTEMASEILKPTVKRSVSENKLNKDSPAKTSRDEKLPPTQSAIKEKASENLKPTLKRSFSDNKLNKESPTQTADEKQSPTKKATTEMVSENVKPTVKRSVNESKLNKDLPTKTADEKQPPTKSSTKEMANEISKPTVKMSFSENKLNNESPTKTADEKQPPTKSSTKEMANEISKPTLKRSFSENKLNKESPTQTADEKQPPAKSATTEIASENFKRTVKRSVSESKLNKDSPTKTADEKQPPAKSATTEMASEILKPTVKRSVSENKLNEHSPAKTSRDEKLPPTQSAIKEIASESLKPTLKRSFSDNKLNKESPTKTADEKQSPTKKATTEMVSENVKPTVKRSVNESKLNKDLPTKTADEKQPPTESATKEIASEISKPTVKRSVSETKLIKDSPTKTAGDKKLPPTKSSTIQEIKSNKKEKHNLMKQGDEESSNLGNSKSVDNIASLKDSWESRWNKSIPMVGKNVDLKVEVSDVKENVVKLNSVDSLSANIKSNDSIKSQSKVTMSIQKLGKHQNTQLNKNNELIDTDINPAKMQGNIKNKESFGEQVPSTVENKRKHNTSDLIEKEQLKNINKDHEMKTPKTTEDNTSVSHRSKGEESVAKSVKSKFEVPKYDLFHKAKHNKAAEIKVQPKNLNKKNTPQQQTQASEKTNVSAKKSTSLESMIATSRTQQNELNGKSKSTLEKTTLRVLQAKSKMNIKKDEPKSKASELNVNENLPLIKHRPPAKISAPILPNIKEKSKLTMEQGKINTKVQSHSVSNDQKKSTKSQRGEWK